MAASTASRCLDLGQLDLRLTPAGLQLQLASLLQLAPSVKDEQWHALTEQIKRKDLRDRPWLCRAANFRVVFGLRIADDIADLDELIESLAGRLRQAQLWRQLCLSATCVEASGSGITGPHTITVSLSHLSPPSQRERRCLHKLGTEVPYHDVQPPEGLLSAPVEATHLAMSITESISRKRKRSKVSHSEPYMPDSSLESVEDLKFVSDCESSGDDMLPLDQEPIMLENDCEGADFDFDDVLLETFGLDGSIDSQSRLHFPFALDDVSSQSSVPLKRSFSALQLPPADSEPQLVDDILQLVEAGIRSAIAKNQRRLPKDIKVKHGEKFYRLGDVLPSVFSPGYVVAVSRRAVFLPTISHALNRVCSRHATTGKQDLGPGVTNGDVPSPAKHSHQLWRLLQASVHDPDAARRLKPLVDGGVNPVNQESLDVLDVTQGTQDSGMLFANAPNDEWESDLEISVDDDDDDTMHLGGMIEDDSLDSAFFDADDLHEDTGGRMEVDETNPLKRLLDRSSHRLETDFSSGQADIHDLVQSSNSRGQASCSDEELAGVFPGTAQEGSQADEMLAI